LDGFCVGEPWNSVAVFAGYGWRAATSSDIAPGHPEKVLMVRREFAESRPEEHAQLIGALFDACRFCHAPENRGRVIELLARAAYVNVPTPILRDGFEVSLGDFDGGEHHHVNDPSPDKAAWLLERMLKTGLIPAAGP